MQAKPRLEEIETLKQPQLLFSTLITMQGKPKPFLLFLEELSVTIFLHIIMQVKS
jgi:hypothetical protein